MRIERFERYVGEDGAAYGRLVETIETPSTPAEVNAERDRRILLAKPVALAGGKAFTVDMANGGRENVGQLGTVAFALQASGVTEAVISFRDADNEDHDLTPAEVIEMGLAVAAQVQAIHLAARELKAMDPVPADVADGPWWPA